jgi:AraC family transcriptional activator of pobA
METSIPNIENCCISKDLSDNFYMRRLDEYIIDNNDMVFPHRHSFFHFVLFTSGDGSYSIDFTNFTIKPYSMYFMAPGQVHTWDFQDIPTGYVVNFGADYFSDFLKHPSMIYDFPMFNGKPSSQVIQVPEHQQKSIIELLTNLYNSTLKNTWRSTSQFQIPLLHLFELMSASSSQVSKSFQAVCAGEKLVQQFINAINEHFFEEKYPSFYAKKLGITIHHLNNICKAHLGKQAGEVIRDRVILEIKRLLIDPTLKIKEISLLVKFNDPSYFSKFFKNGTGMSPEQFKNLHIKHLLM